MSRQAVIVDTNVVVAGLLTGNAASPVARILDGMLAAAFPFVVSEVLLAEYRTVLVRPGLRKLHGLTVTEVETLLTDIAQHAIVPAPGAGSPAPDAGDQLLWDLLAAKPDLLLVTGDKALQRDAAMRSRVLSPQAFADGP
ncbi:MAG TPA: PIN domain-containing protein [Rubrivivax sp.]|nr:PIN domain-containing protein [Pseudomonadota bacterium]HOW47841.1 PIN domain-containing protein [Rubrivivax sp.]HRY90426.1 PIN domain-containing protein [Rubrivivax sp.]HRZ61753.1 PIN domain-containing protein [Rubrivivax sp.]